ncbi:MAG: isochorismatase family protein [gamma proteobacterium symbiont of Bathyaustriella thionipta]|nr:isochorismatase family protein [gamma proteobacterium symbiont of Bathyaustriella thionipta]
MSARQHHHLLTCRAGQSQLLAIDLQQRLLAAMPEAVARKITRNTDYLLNSARRLEIPVIATRQYPQGLGEFDARLKPALNGLEVCDKTSFSCCAAAGFETRLEDASERPHIILCGVETHICILQTAASLQAWGYQVFIAADAVSSRHYEMHKNALARMALHDIHISNTESIVFEWLEDATHEAFRELSKPFKN